MTTTKFIKLIKDCQNDREKLFKSDWDFTQSTNGKPLLIFEDELGKIEKVNVELLEACLWSVEQFKILANKGQYPEHLLAKNGRTGFLTVVNTINEAHNIKQI